MPIQRISNLNEAYVEAFNAIAGTPTGGRFSINAPIRGQLIEAGFVPNSLVASAMTLSVAIGNNQLSSTASSFTQVVTSTLGTFSSVNLIEGACCSVVPPSPAYVNAGDAIQFDAMLEHEYRSLEECKLMLLHLHKGKRI